MKKIFILTAAAVLFAACSLDSDFYYQAPKDSIYFNYLDTTKHTVSYTFAYDLTEEEHTLYLPVIISGERIPSERRFKVVVDSENTTAQAGLHYKAFDASYPIAAGKGTYQLPVTLYNNDIRLLDETVKLTLNLVASDDFYVAFPYLTIAVVNFSCRLEEPDWWKSWKNQLGNYSRDKHFLFNAATNDAQLGIPGGGDLSVTPAGLYNIALAKELLSDPFRWVGNNPAFAMTPKPDGNYLFHSVATPERAVLYNSTTKYFVDENGLNIIINWFKPS